jgi:hypothetical protein
LIGEKGTEKNILFLPLVIERTQLINVPLQHREKNRGFSNRIFSSSKEMKTIKRNLPVIIGLD